MIAPFAFVPGDLVDVAVFSSGPPTRSPVGYLRGVVMHAGIEVDVRLLLADEDPRYGQDVEDVEFVLAGAGDVDLGGLAEGPIYTLRNCQMTEVAVVAREELPRDVYVALRERWLAETPDGARDRSRLIAAIERRLGVRPR